MIKKALLAAGASLIAFAVGLIGAFFLLPMVAPDFAEELLNPPDSTAMPADSLMLADSDSLAPNPARALLDSLAHDSTAVLDSTLLRALEPGMLTIHEDSIAALRADLRDKMRTQEALEQELATLRTEVADLRARKDDMTELSATLARIDDRQLAPILRELDMASLEVLYAESTGRNRTRLLQAMPAERAARFINERISGTDAPNAAN
ncbi:MAG: hypothetical protein GVY12_02320 [Bacteroidetes bacterium]|jgi:septal ring factor EnvC (AmiA/AmiB activator)|nr:hypothetical protein [Bacteroidota bacterium]